MTLLIRDATVVTMDATGTVHAPGAVLVDGAVIADAGPSEEVANRAPAGCEVMEAQGRIALPGFVSAHNHLGYTVFRGRAEDVGHSPTHRLYLPMSMVMRRDEREALGSLAVAELLCGGVTTVLEWRKTPTCSHRSSSARECAPRLCDDPRRRSGQADGGRDGVRRAGAARPGRAGGPLRTGLAWGRRRTDQRGDHRERARDLVAGAARGTPRGGRSTGTEALDSPRERRDAHGEGDSRAGFVRVRRRKRISRRGCHCRALLPDRRARHRRDGRIQYPPCSLPAHEPVPGRYRAGRCAARAWR